MNGIRVESYNSSRKAGSFSFLTDAASRSNAEIASVLTIISQSNLDVYISIDTLQTGFEGTFSDIVNYYNRPN